MKYKHLLRLNRGRTDKHPLRLNRGRTEKQLHHVNRGRTEKLQSQRLKQTDENHQTFDPTKIPRGRSKTDHQLKFKHQQIFKNNRRPQFYKRKLYQQILMDKYPHQLAKNDVN